MNVSRTARKWLLFAHLCGGLLAAIYAVAIGISGAVLVFHDELNRAFDSKLAGGAGNGAASVDQVVKTAQEALAGWQLISVTYPNQDSPYWMTYAIKGREAREVFAETSAGAIVEVRDPKAGFLGWLQQLHVNLLIGRAGSTANGIGAMFLLFLAVTGAYLWWSGGPRRAKRLFGGWDLGWRRWTWTLHQGTGVVSAIFVAMLAITGSYFIWPQLFVPVVERWWPRSKPVAVPAHPQEAERMSLTKLDAIARAAIPGLPIHRLSIANDVKTAVRVTLRESDVAAFHLVSTAVLDPVTGEVLQTTRLATRPAGDGILGWFAALHIGVVAGFGGKVVWALLSLMLPVLSVTGFCMWWRRVVEPRQKKSRMRQVMHAQV